MKMKAIYLVASLLVLCTACTNRNTESDNNELQTINEMGNTDNAADSVDQVLSYFDDPFVRVHVTDTFNILIRNGKYGYIDNSGNIIIEPQFENCSYFRFHNAPAKLNGRWGIIDLTGKFIIDPIFDNTDYFIDGLAGVKIGEGKSGKWGFVDTNGHFVIDPLYVDFKDFYVDTTPAAKLVGEDKKWGVIDRKGNVIVDFKYDKVEYFNQYGLAEVEVYGPEGYEGVVDKTGRCVLTVEIDHEPRITVTEDIICVRKDSLYALADRNGKYITDFQFENVCEFDEGIGRTIVGKKYGFVNKKGKFVIEPKYDWADRFKDGYCNVYINNDSNGKNMKYRIDKTGKVVSEEEMTSNIFE